MNFDKNWCCEKYEIKKSKFISFCFSISSINDFNNLFETIKKEYMKATHICFAYKFIENNQIKIKYFDDNEPKGTAGVPILNVIEKNNLNNVVIFVVRYFGGTKLGSGTLLRSYLKVALLSSKKVNKL